MAAIAFWVAALNPAWAQTITTVAGGGLGDGGLAVNAILNFPSSVALDAAGNLFVADREYHRIRRVAPNGVITTVAGNGEASYGGDGGVATAASLNEPAGVAVDAAGNIFIADAKNQRVRKVAAGGTITTVAGNGAAAFGGDAGAATAASLNTPSAVALDAAGNLYIADLNNNRIRKVATNGTIATVAGNGTAGFAGDGGQASAASLHSPSGLALDAVGNLLVADLGNGRIRKVGSNGVIATVAGYDNSPPTMFTSSFSGDGGPATAARLYNPWGVALDAAGNLFIADHGNGRIRKVSTNGVITTVAGNGQYGSSGDGGQALAASFESISAVALDTAGNLYIADPVGNRIRKMNAGGVMSTVAGVGAFAGDGGQAVAARLYGPASVAFDATGNLFISDRNNGRVRKVGGNGVITTVAGNGVLAFAGDGGQATAASLYTPEGVVVDAAGNVYIADSSNHRIRRVNAAGIIATVAGDGSAGYAGDGGAATAARLQGPTGLALDAGGNLYIADTSNSRIRKVSTGGIITTVAGSSGLASFSGDGGPATAASLSYPEGVAVDAAGNIYIADSNNNRIRKVATNGVITTVAGSPLQGFSGDGGAATAAGLRFPTGVAVDAAGNLYIADAVNNRIRKVDANGIIATVAGNGVRAYYGEGAPAIVASLNLPGGVALDAAGDLFIADSQNHRVRKVATSGLVIPRLGNISTRMQVLTGNDVMIGGFIIGGATPKTVVVRARGPSLIPFGITNALANPKLDLYSGQTVIATNDDFGTAANLANLQASGFAPSDAKESAIYTTLSPGAYTAIVSGVGGATGVGIVEVFEVDHPEVPLANISTRGQVLTGNDVMIGGFIINGTSPQTVVVRARGPSLIPFGITNALGNPVLQLFSGQTLIASNDDWGSAANAAAITSSGFAPDNALESAILITLNPGAYTAIVTGANGSTGVGIVEVFAQ